MKALVVYDSVYGNTEQIARAIGEAVSSDSMVLRAGQLDTSRADKFDIMVVGSPTLGGRASEPIQNILKNLPEAMVKGVKVAAFDTRYGGRFVKIFGFAAEKIADALKAKGGIMVAPPEGFIVKGKKGPLQDGELERAANWARKLV